MSTNLKYQLPEMLNIPAKMLPMITEFNNYDIFLAEGGRGSGKSHSVGRFLLYLGDVRKLRIVCGREIAVNIEESVYTLLKDLIEQYELPYDVMAFKIRHKYNGTEIQFKGFREQGNVSIKGLEGVDILWIDEAQSISKNTLDVIMPTMRKENVRVFFTMNRFLREDAVPEYCAGKKNCLHIKVNFFENPHCPLSLKIQAEECRQRSERDYKHIWLGEPIQQADDFLFNFDKLHESFDIKPFGDLPFRQRVMGIDFAAQGNDLCVATLLERVSPQHWRIAERISWDEPDTMVSVGRIVNLLGDLKPDVSVLDIGGMGKPVYDRLIEVIGGTKTVLHPFDGSKTDGIDKGQYGNVRAAAYFELRDWFDSGFICTGKEHMEVIKELEKIKMKYRSSGARMIQAKVDMKKELGYSPDNADSLMMSVWAASKYLGKKSNYADDGASGHNIVRKSGSNRQRRRS